MRTMERVGGEVLSGLAPAAMSAGALAAVEARLNEPAPAAVPAPATPAVGGQDIPGLPGFVRHYRFGPWKWIAPAVHLRPIVLPYAERDPGVSAAIRPRHPHAAAFAHRP